MSNVSKAWAVLDGKKVAATFDETTGLWTVEMTAPATSSWTQPDHVYRIELHAEDQAGNTATMTAADETYGEQLKIRVLELTKPVAKINTPTENSIIGKNTVDVELEVSDEGESGINLTTVVFKVNGEDKAGELTWAKDETNTTADVRKATITLTGLNDGNNAIKLSVSDNDGNSSNEAVVNFVVSTAAPTLEITSPAEGVITNAGAVTISGNTGTSVVGVGVSSVTVNGTPITIGTDGTFSYEYTLTEGINTITIIATDTAGNSTQVIRTVVMDQTAPVITDVQAEAVVVNASGMIRITFKVTDAPAPNAPSEE